MYCPEIMIPPHNVVVASVLIALNEMNLSGSQVTIFCDNKLMLFMYFNSGPYRPGVGEPRGKDYPPSANVGQMDRPNDCEIIVVNKNQR
jgi:hypothetical protein